MLSDLFILKKIKEGDIKAFEGVFRQYYSSLYLYAFSITGRRDVSEEVVQELFYVIWKERENIQIRLSLKSYLYRAVRNQSLQYCEHKNVEDRHREKVLNNSDLQGGTLYSPQEDLEYRELEDVVDSTLRKLPERRLRIFRMHRMEGKKYKEIAESLSISIKTVEAEMSKAYSLLRHEIEKYIHVL
jgi:RNA polymerase sigma-70 factor (ECF subfamily)